LVANIFIQATRKSFESLTLIPSEPQDAWRLAGRAGILRHRAELLARKAASENRDEGRRRYLLDQAATFQRAADEMAPATGRTSDIVNITSGN
jgi:hypothetical protein